MSINWQSEMKDGEKLIWDGAPNRAIFRKKYIRNVAFLFAPFTPLFAWVIYVDITDPTSVTGQILGPVHLVLVVAMAVSIFWFYYINKCREFYALSSDRVLIYFSPPYKFARNYVPAEGARELKLSEISKTTTKRGHSIHFVTSNTTLLTPIWFTYLSDQKAALQAYKEAQSNG